AAWFWQAEPKGPERSAGTPTRRSSGRAASMLAVTDPIATADAASTTGEIDQLPAARVTVPANQGPPTTAGRRTVEGAAPQPSQARRRSTPVTPAAGWSTPSASRSSTPTTTRLAPGRPGAIAIGTRCGPPPVISSGDPGVAAATGSVR